MVSFPSFLSNSITAGVRKPFDFRALTSGRIPALFLAAPWLPRAGPFSYTVVGVNKRGDCRSPA